MNIMTTPFRWTPDTAGSRLKTVFEKAKNDPAAKAVFLKLLEKRGMEQASKAAGNASPLSGALVSVKALFDVSGETTSSATKVLLGNPPAETDATAIARLSTAGAVFTGVTNMSEFAYSGLGLNPHYGTPENPVYPGCAPGGSTSGGAVSVALGLSDIAIGSDTGGSLRIPAAFTGITGFKPTQASVPMQGGVPLSDSLDSFGPMARSVAECEIAWQIMADREVVPAPAEAAELVVPVNFGFSEIDSIIADGFSTVMAKLRAAGFKVIEEDLQAISLYDQVPPWHMTSVESRAHFEDHYQNRSNDFDPRVHARMGRAEEISAVEYRQTLNRRARFIKAFQEELGGRMLLLPTTPILPPDIDSLADDATFNRLNLLALRNPSLANVADACSIAPALRT